MRARRPGESNSAAGPVPLSLVLEKALDRLRPPELAASASDAILFAGNRQESVPRALFLDIRLTPLERNAWQVFRILLQDDGMNAFPTYEQLRPYLTSLPYAGQASEETVARALTMLRLTRWLTLARHRRDAATGRVQGNLYVLHDEALTPYEAIQLDPHYLELVSQALTHASKTIQRVGSYALKELTEDPMLSGQAFPSRLHMIVQRLADCEPAHSPPTSESEDGEGWEASRLRIPKTESAVRTVRTDLINEKVRTVQYEQQEARLRLPEAFGRLKPEQQSGALTALERVKSELRQLVLDEWAARCGASIRNPAGYLFGIIQKALRGDFHATDKATHARRVSSPRDSDR